MSPVRLIRAWFGRFASLFRKRERDAEFAAELESHLQLHIEDKLRAGMTPEAARRDALMKLGGIEQAKESYRDRRGLPFLESALHDVRLAFRTLRKSPGLTAAVVLTLALGIGANTAIFTLVNAVMLKSLPVANPEQLYRLGDNNNCCVMAGTQNGGSFVLYSYSLYESLRDHTPEFSEVAAFTPWTADLSVRRGVSPAEPYKAEFVSGNYFNTFGIRGFAGRLLAPSDDSAGAPPVAVMNYHTWQRRFGLDPSVIGSTLYIDGAPCVIAGVTPPGFYGDTLRSDPPDFWMPLAADPEGWRLPNPGVEWLYLVGRLKSGFAPEAVQARLTVELQGWLNSHKEVIPERDRKDIPQQHVHLTPAIRGVEILQTDYETGLQLLMTLSALLLLITCANIANLLLARGSANRSQTAVLAGAGSAARQADSADAYRKCSAGAGGWGGGTLLSLFRGPRHPPTSLSWGQLYSY